MTRRADVRSFALCLGFGRVSRVALLAVWAGMMAGCDRLDMYDQPRYEPLEASPFFGDGLSARPPVEGTVARGALREDVVFFTGKDDDHFTNQIPAAAYQALYDRSPQQFAESFDHVAEQVRRQALLERGHQRFDIYCSVCHGRTGDGDGMIVRRGFRKPPSYHTDRLRDAAAGHYYDVISNGFGAMAGYASRIEPADRWAIVAYIRALQLSQHAGIDDVPTEQRESLDSIVVERSPTRASQEASP